MHNKTHKLLNLASVTKHCICFLIKKYFKLQGKLCKLHGLEREINYLTHIISIHHF